MSEVIDIHCHLYQTKQNQNDITNSQDQARIILVSTALDHKEVNWHLQNNITYWFAGIHPQNWSLSRQEIETYLEKLPYEKILGIGEMGLDKRYKNQKKQIDLLDMQMSKADIKDLPSIYHLVGYEYAFIKLHKLRRLKRMKIIHGFHSSYEVYKELDKLGFYFSLSNRILANPKHEVTISEILKKKRYFIESDAPDGGHLDEVKRVANILQINYNINKYEIKQVVEENFNKLVKERCESKSKK